MRCGNRQAKVSRSGEIYFSLKLGQPIEKPIELEDEQPDQVSTRENNFSSLNCLIEDICIILFLSDIRVQQKRSTENQA